METVHYMCVCVCVGGGGVLCKYADLNQPSQNIAYHQLSDKWIITLS